MLDITLLDQTTLRPSDDNFATAFAGIQWYAIFVILGFFVSIIIICYRCEKYYKIKYDFIFYFALICLPTSFFGARIWSGIIGDLDWVNFFNLRSGGFAIQGGIILTSLIALIYFPLMLEKTKYHVRVEEEGKVFIKKPSMWIIFDAIFPVILLGQAIGRWGNFFNGEIFGSQVSPENLAWLKTILPGVYEKMQCVAGVGTLHSGLEVGAFYQPLFLYESIINLSLFPIIYFILPKIKKIRLGLIGSLYFISYGIIRFCMEPIRNDSFNFTGTFVVNGLLLAFGIIMLIISQWIAPHYRGKMIIYKCYCEWIRKPAIKSLKLFNKEKYSEFINLDPELTNFGYHKKIDFIRKESDKVYYANK